MTILGKKQMSEEDIKLNYITPVILDGWKGPMDVDMTDNARNSAKNKCNAALHVCRIFFLPSKGHLCGVALDFSNNWVAFFLYCVIINGGSLNRNLTDCTGPHAPSEGVGRPKGGLEVVPTRNFTDLLVQLQIRNNPQSAWLTCGSGDGRVAQ